MEAVPCVPTFPVDSFSEAQLDSIEDIGELPAKESLLPQRLSETGLYIDIVQKSVHPAMLPYQPEFQLWSDGEEKSRWTYVPECDKIDTTRMDDWSFPVGTRFFKEFKRDGRRIETRLIERFGSGPRDFAMASYQWDEAENEALRVAEAGVQNVAGTGHTIPPKSQCLHCHGTYAFGGGRPSRGLGFSAIQLSHNDTETSLGDLVASDRLTRVPGREFTVPGEGSTRQALGYLHANCGNCHNDSRDGLPQSDLDLWVSVDDDHPEETGAYQTAVGQPANLFSDQQVQALVSPGLPEQSALYHRMSQRGNVAQMPPIATKVVDAQGLEFVRAWVEGVQ